MDSKIHGREWRLAVFYLKYITNNTSNVSIFLMAHQHN